MMLKEIKSWLIVGLVILAVLFSPNSVIAVSIYNLDQVTVLHSSPEKTLFLGQDQFKFRHFVDDAGKDAEEMAIADLTLMPDNDSILFKKHAVDTADNLYVLEGSMQCVVEASESVIDLQTGDLLKVPAGVPYGCQVIGNSPSHLMLITSAPILENIMAEIGSQDRPLAGEPVDLSVEDLVDVAQKYGSNFLN